MLAKRFLFLALLLFAVVLPAQAQTISVPAILYFKADMDSLPYTDVEAGTAAANFSWNVVGLTSDYYLQMHAWVNEQWGLVGEKFDAKKSDRIVISHPQDFGLPMYRLSVVNQQGVIVASSFLQMHYAAPDPDARPHVTAFSTSITAVNANQLTDGKVFIPVRWVIDHRWPQVNPVFEQILPDGSVVSVELPRRNRWLPRLGDGLVTPRAVEGQPVILQMRLVDVETDQTLDTRQITLPVNASAPLTASTAQSTSAADNAPSGNTAPTSSPQDAGFYDPRTPGFFFQSDRTQILDDNRTVTLSWMAPGASQVWIEMRAAGTTGCAQVSTLPDNVYGPMDASGRLTPTLPDGYQSGARFELYVNHYTGGNCNKDNTSTARLDVNIPVLKPGEYFRANATPDTGTNDYTITPGDWVDLSWQINNGLDVYLTSYYDAGITPSVRVAASGSLRVCPRPGWNYYSLIFGDPQTSSLSASLVLNVSDSQDYPANRGEGNPCWKTP